MDVAGTPDFRHVSWFLQEMTVNPHYCSNCHSVPCITLLWPGAAMLSQPAAAEGRDRTWLPQRLWTLAAKRVLAPRVVLV